MDVGRDLRGVGEGGYDQNTLYRNFEELTKNI